MDNILEQKAILFGAGGVGLMALDYFGLEKVECFVDNNKLKVNSQLCGKPIISFDELLLRFANKKGYRIYIATDTFFNELSEQLNRHNVSNYTFYRDFIPDYCEVKHLISDVVKKGSKIAIVGTNNASELVLNALNELKFDNNIIGVFDYDNSNFIGNEFYDYRTQKVSDLMKYLNKQELLIISSLPDEIINQTFNIEMIKKKIIYSFEAIKYLPDDYLREKKNFEELDPDKVLSFKRMDIIPRYLLAKAIISNCQQLDFYKSLYARSILLWNNADEKIGVFSSRAKQTVNEHISAMYELLEEMSKNGFDKNKYIPINSDGVLLDGAHRLAAALSLNEKVFVRKLNNHSNPVSFDWYVKNGFDLRDQLEILRGYADLYKNCGIFVVFAPAISKLYYIKSQIEKRMSIVGHVDLDFSNNFYAFQNIINEIYYTYQGNKAMEKKIQLLLLYPLKLRIVLTSDEDHDDKNIYAWMTQLKLELRDNLTIDIPSEEYITIHGTDSKEEFEVLKEVVLSFNNYRQMISRVTPTYRNEYCERIGKLKVFLKKEGIPLNSICVVSGSNLEAMGIRFSDDIDCIASSNVRKALNTNSTYKLDNELEIISSGRMRDDEGSLISDDSVIFNHNNYFILYGVKFCNIDLVKNQKKYAAICREKDKRDIRLIEIFQDYSTYFDSNSELKKRMKLQFPIGK